MNEGFDAWRVSLMLVDAAQVVDGKLYILGGGWSTIRMPCSYAIAAVITVPWGRAEEDHAITLALVDADGKQVIVERKDGPKAVVLSAALKVVRPLDFRPGSGINCSLALSVVAWTALPPGVYEWRCSINGRSHDDWSLPFTVVASESGGGR